MKRTGIGLTAVVAVVAGLASFDGPAVAQDIASGPTDGQVLPYPGQEGLIWIPAWIGDGGAVTGGASPDRPFTVTVGCQGSGNVQVTVTPQYGNTDPVSFPVACAGDAPGVASRVLDGEQGRSFGVRVDTSSSAIRWGLTATQAD